MTGDGVVNIVQLLHEHKGNISRLRLDGISRMSKHHLDIIMSLMCKGNPQGQQDGIPLFYNHRAREALNTNDERPIDVDVCSVCANVRLVFDCTRDDCRYATSDPLNSHETFSLEIALAVYWTNCHCLILYPLC